MRSQVNAPCRDCPDRYLACHDHCPKYQAFRAERERLYAEKQISSNIYEVFKDSKIRKMRKEKNHG